MNDADKQEKRSQSDEREFVSHATFQSFDDPEPGSAGVQGALDLESLLDLRVPVSIELASTQRSIADILALGPGSVLELDRQTKEPVDILVGGMRLARGEIVHVGERYGIRITEIVDPEERVRFANQPDATLL